MLQSQFNTFELNNCLVELEKIVYSLLQNGFVVLEQPCSSILKNDPLTIISNAKFETKLCFLWDSKLVTLDHNVNGESHSELL